MFFFWETTIVLHFFEKKNFPQKFGKKNSENFFREFFNFFVVSRNNSSYECHGIPEEPFFTTLWVQMPKQHKKTQKSNWFFLKKISFFYFLVYGISWNFSSRTFRLWASFLDLLNQNISRQPRLKKPSQNFKFDFSQKFLGKITFLHCFCLRNELKF